MPDHSFMMCTSVSFDFIDLVTALYYVYIENRSLYYKTMRAVIPCNWEIITCNTHTRVYLCNA